MGYVILIILGLIIIGILAMERTITGGISHDHRKFDYVPFSPQEFYEALHAAMHGRGINHVSTRRIFYSEGGLLSPRREYFRIQYQQYAYDICAAPFANGYFVSWRLGEMGENPFQEFFMKLPLIGGLFKSRPKTFFELDTELMFKESVSTCIKETIEQLISEKGVRQPPVFTRPDIIL